MWLPTVLLMSFILFVRSEENTQPIKHDVEWAQDVLSDSEQETASERINKINNGSDIELFEGDMMIDDNETAIDGSDDGPEKRNAARDRKYLWKDKIVPYKIADILVQEAGSGAAIQAAIDEFTNNTCIRWKPHQNEPNWVLFMRGGGCYSYIGMQYWRTGSQDISLDTGCIHHAIILHEMMHAVGFVHEQSRPDRDQYVEIMWENIEPGKEHNFNKYTSNIIDYLGEVYDLGSLMHYGKYSFAINPSKPTIQAVGDPDKQLGQWNGLSPTDIAQVNALYDCSSPSGGWSSWSEFGPCTSQCNHTRQRFCSSRDRNNCPGADVYGVETETADCPHAKCCAPLDGHWGRWSSWSSCSVTCDYGTHTRTRQCDNPAPKNNGTACAGDSQQTGKCEMRRCGMGPYDCEFEGGGMCHWKTCAINSSPTWLRHTGATGSPGTGPLGDHTSGSGYYMYLEASSPAQPGQTACFQSQELPKTMCRLTFWYHMYGTDIGVLRVLSEEGDGSINKTLWSKTGQQQQQQGDPWLQASVDISSSSSFKIFFEGTIGDNFRGDIAVDDVEFKECSAPLDGHWGRWSSWSSCSVTCDSGTHTRTRKCDNPAPKNNGTACAGDSQQTGKCEMRRCGMGPYDCEFEAGGMCHWKTCGINSYPAWHRNSGATNSSVTGPLGDHTSGSGYYMYLEASNPAQTGQTACFQSQELPKTMCRLTFWYHMYGTGIGALKVLSEEGDGSINKTLWSKTGQQQQKQDDPWLQASVDISSSSSFKIFFEGTIGDNFRGDIAVDDVEFKECSVDGQWGHWKAVSPCVKECGGGLQKAKRKCDNPAPLNNGKDCVGDSEGQVMCLNRRCDKGPYDCEFEADGMCGWKVCEKENKTIQPHWGLHTGWTPSYNNNTDTGPSRDHTLPYDNGGHYMYLNTSAPAQPGEKDCFHSTMIPPSSCWSLSFWYHMNVADIGTLAVNLKNYSLGEVISNLWSKTGYQTSDWLPAYVTFSNSDPVQIYFEGVRGDGFSGDIAIDDVEIRQCVTDKCNFDGMSFCSWNPRGLANVSPKPEWEIKTDEKTGQVYASSVRRSKGRLISRKFLSTSSVCLRFMMRCSKKAKSALSVFLVYNQDPLKKRQSKRVKYCSTRWTHQQKPFQSDKPFHLVFQSTMKKGFVYLDNIEVRTGACTGR